VVVPATCASGQKFSVPRVAKLLEDQVPPALPSARRRSVWPGSRSEPPRDQISVSGKVLPGMAASVGIESHRGLVVIRWRACSVPPMVEA
jgi:hypothetical protein